MEECLLLKLSPTYTTTSAKLDITTKEPLTMSKRKEPQDSDMSDHNSDSDAPVTKEPKTPATKPTNPVPHKASTFLTLPLELRQKILFYALEPLDGLDPDDREEDQEIFREEIFPCGHPFEDPESDQVYKAQQEYCRPMHEFADVMIEAFSELEDEMKLPLEEAEKTWGLDEDRALEVAEEAYEKIFEEEGEEYYREAYGIGAGSSDEDDDEENEDDEESEEDD